MKALDGIINTCSLHCFHPKFIENIVQATSRDELACLQYYEMFDVSDEFD